ncbi:hypothetical protein RFI_16665 [Reticulomyxa filosa]|uniref:Uncharacterized protein n=1 Tax=Reticulomyxa filosa TaxID=46433 RepID=X6N5G8_RETFI|nr:hypothetical protein RFI_16665 [Reticulomyxa filosa]|eukprot:ETO20552.1 hypothetical protein RFI_16665 [Reticulomyxa filosa]
MKKKTKHIYSKLPQIVGVIQRWEREKILLETPGGLSDDLACLWAMLYSTRLYGTEVFVVTNDRFVDHMFSMGMQVPFRNFLTTHIIRYNFDLKHPFSCAIRPIGWNRLLADTNADPSLMTRPSFDFVYDKASTIPFDVDLDMREKDEKKNNAYVDMDDPYEIRSTRDKIEVLGKLSITKPKTVKKENYNSDDRNRSNTFTWKVRTNETRLSKQKTFIVKWSYNTFKFRLVFPLSFLIKPYIISNSPSQTIWLVPCNVNNFPASWIAAIFETSPSSA